jgi:hypothetical protein
MMPTLSMVFEYYDVTDIKYKSSRIYNLMYFVPQKMSLTKPALSMGYDIAKPPTHCTDSYDYGLLPRILNILNDFFC